MRSLAIAAAAAGLAILAAPAAAGPDRFHYEEDEIVRALPHPAEVAETAYRLDRVLGALLDIDVAPIARAVDPYAPPGPATLRDMGHADDPYFEDRLRHTLYGTTAGLGAMMESFAALAPVVGHSLRDIEARVADAMARGGYPAYPDY